MLCNQVHLLLFLAVEEVLLLVLDSVHDSAPQRLADHPAHEAELQRQPLWRQGLTHPRRGFAALIPIEQARQSVLDLNLAGLRHLQFLVRLALLLPALSAVALWRLARFLR